MNRKAKILFILTLLTITALTDVFLRENYPQRIWNRCNNFVHNRPNVKPHNYTENYSYEQQTGFYPLYRSPKKVVMLGSSITSRIDWREIMDRPDISNMGINDDVTEGYLHRLVFIKELKPEICFIEGGINDVFYYVSQYSTLKNLRNIIEDLKGSSIIPVLTTVCYVSHDFPEASIINNRIKKLNVELVKLASAEQIRLIDLNSLLSEGDFINNDYVISDGLHLNGKAYLIWGKEISKILGQSGI